jgi:hypothetical protein
MNYPLFEDVVLTKDISAKGLRKGDVATVIDYHPVADGKDGYSLEIFNALGETIAVVTVAESAIAPLTANEIFSVRPLALKGATL